VDSVTAAHALTDKFSSTSQMLADLPLAGRARPELRDDLRSFPVGSYVIFYAPLPDGVTILRILHGRRDITPEDLE